MMAQTQNSILRISDEKTLQLIDLYEKEECLWNTYSDDYKCREKRLKAAERVARRLNIKHFESRHVVIKFKNLRNSYCQELKKIVASHSMGLSEENIYKPKVFWFSKMDSFLRPHLQPSRCSFQTLQVSEVDVEDFIKVEARSDSNDSNAQSNDNDNTSEMSESHYPVIEHSESVHSDDCIRLPEPRTLTKRTLSCAPPISPKRLREETRSDDVKQMMRDMSNKIDALVEEKKEDYYDTFGKYIASLLRSIPKERAMMLQPQVISLIVSGSGFGEGSVSQSDGNDI